MKKLFFLSLTLLCVVAATAKVRLPQMFQSGMVLQRGMPVPVWGTADAGETVVVRMGKKKYQTTAAPDGQWRIDLPAMKAGGPFQITINDAVLDDVYVGDVWLCSGQLNMETTIERVYPQYPAEIDSDDNPLVRMLHVKYQTDTRQPQTDIQPTRWVALNKDNCWRLSAIGYFLGKAMQARTGVAQGIICSSWGGTPIEAWVSADTLRQHFPLYYRQTQLYQNDTFISAQQQANQQAQQQWQRILDQDDPGQQANWTLEQTDDSQWPTVNQYALPKALPGREFVGSLWLRQHISIDRQHAGKKARLLLGTLFDCDYTYINGREVGRTYYQYPPRRYDVPEGLLHEGDNVITVRFINKYGVPHFINEKKYQLVFASDDVQPLGEQWLMHEGVRMPKCPGADMNVHYQPSVLFNGMIAPLAPFAVSGVVWYQGESNTDQRAQEYAAMLRYLMGNWREAFGRPDLPFTVVQLANYMEPSPQPQNTGWSAVREAQRVVAHDDAHAQLAVTIDLGETVDIHPLRKKEVAERIALAFDRMVFGKKVVLSPEVIDCVADGSRVVLTLDQPLRPGRLKYFELAGDDGCFVNAEAYAEGQKITVSSNISAPKHLRYAWKNNPLDVNVYGLTGMPLAPFQRTVR